MLSHLQNIPIQLLDSIPSSTYVNPSSTSQCLSLHSALQSSAALSEYSQPSLRDSYVSPSHDNVSADVVSPRNGTTHRRRGVGVSRRGGRSKKRLTKHDAAYRQMEALGSFVEESSRTDISKLDTSSVPYEVLADPTRYQHERWREGFSIKLGADGRRLLLRKLRAIYGGSPDKWSPLFHEMGINAKNVFTMATVPCLFKIAYIMGANAWDFALKCACFTVKCSALKNTDNSEPPNDADQGEVFPEEEEDEEDALNVEDDRMGVELDPVQSSSPSEESRPANKRPAKSPAAKRKRLKPNKAVAAEDLRGVKTRGASSERDDNTPSTLQHYSNGMRADERNRAAGHFPGSATTHCAPQNMYPYNGSIMAQPVYYYGNDGQVYQTYSDESSPMSPYVPEQHLAAGGGGGHKDEYGEEREMMVQERGVKWEGREEDGGDGAGGGGQHDQYYYEQLATSLPSMGGADMSGGYPYILGSYSYDISGVDAQEPEQQASSDAVEHQAEGVEAEVGGEDVREEQQQQQPHHTPTERRPQRVDVKASQAQEVFEAFRAELATSRKARWANAAAAAHRREKKLAMNSKTQTPPSSSAVPLNVMLSQTTATATCGSATEPRPVIEVPPSVLAALRVPNVEKDQGEEAAIGEPTGDGKISIGCQTTMSCVSTDVCLVPVAVLLQGWSQHVDIRKIAQQSAEMYERSCLQHASLKQRLVSGGWLPQAGVDALDEAYDIPLQRTPDDVSPVVAVNNTNTQQQQKKGRTVEPKFDWTLHEQVNEEDVNYSETGVSEEVTSADHAAAAVNTMDSVDDTTTTDTSSSNNGGEYVTDLNGVC
eukprot:GHVS01059873.1.p1 GENE.GHVS01059873.1~~GHVS01059873.1.p1  ORF type:complete len:824 (+),score=170.77 GHVS01059873.1:168-2639(+)